MKSFRSMSMSPGAHRVPEALIDGIIHLHEKVKRMRLDSELREPVRLS
jgi:NADH:ubiquinone oxidoreductase subunit B-like Fe-S oxidoreductase